MRGGRSGGPGLAVHFSHCRFESRPHLRNTAQGDLGRRRARPYALSMMAAVWLTVLLVHVARREKAWLWMSYGIVLVASVLLDIYLALMVLAHFAFLCIYRHSRPVIVRFAVTVDSDGLCCDTVCGRGCRSSASDHLDRTGRAPDARRCGGSTVFRAKPVVHGCVGATDCVGCCPAGASHPRSCCRMIGKC